MKQLLLLRHAHAHSSLAGVDDIERQIDSIGLAEADNAAKHIAATNINLQYIMCSPAVRTKQTAYRVCDGIGYQKSALNIEKRIYLNTLDELLDCVHELDDQYGAVMLVGHNPGLSYLAAYLSGDSAAQLSTGDVCLLSSKVERWNNLNFHAAQYQLLTRKD